MQIVPTRSVLLAVTLSIGLPVLVVSPSIYFPTTGMELAYLAGRLFGLVAFLIISFQYLWTARIKLMERLRSYDRRVAVHRALGFLEILILCLNPILILGTYAIEGLPLSVTLPMGLRFLALLLLLLIAGSTFLSRIWRVRYETWKRLHWITFPVLTLAFLHSLALGLVARLAAAFDRLGQESHLHVPLAVELVIMPGRIVGPLEHVGLDEGLRDLGDLSLARLPEVDDLDGVVIDALVLLDDDLFDVREVRRGLLEAVAEGGVDDVDVEINIVADVEFGHRWAPWSFLNPVHCADCSARSLCVRAI